MVAEVECRCSNRPETNWSYCEDDFFCPSCGQAVTRVITENRYPDPAAGEIWVYPRTVGKNDMFAFPVQVEHSNSNREVRVREPELQLAECQVNAPSYFRPQLENAPHKYRSFIALVPTHNDKNNSLPDEGVNVSVPKLVGDFADTSLELRVGKMPEFDIQLTGKGIERHDDRNKKDEVKENADKEKPFPTSASFNITSSGLLDLRLTIRALTAPVMITDSHKIPSLLPIKGKDDTKGKAGDSLAFKFDDELKPGTPIIPEVDADTTTAGKSWFTNATLDTTKFTETGQTASCKAVLSFVGSWGIDFKLDFTRIEEGGLDITPVTIDEMFLGEIRSNEPNDHAINPEDVSSGQPVIAKMYVQNVGNYEMALSQPVIESTNSEFEWAKASWSKDIDDGSKEPSADGRIMLAPDARGEVRIEVDLRKVKPAELGDLRTLIARVRFTKQAPHQDEEETFYSNVIISRVRPRTAAPSPLTIDFGNSSSFAAIWNPNEQAISEEVVIPVHDLRDPERFPTALFFQEAGKDPYQAKYLIGRAAVAEGEKQAADRKFGALISDIKRWIGAPGYTKNIIDSENQATQQYKIRFLIGLFLKRVIENAESILRRYTITNICVSHPAKFTKKRRDRFFDFVDDMCVQVNKSRDKEMQLTRSEEDVDEANAVAVGSVFDTKTEAFLKKMINPDNTKFVVASFDMGGGSLDTALIEFDVLDGEMLSPLYTTEYLGIGGHPEFGGDNVTLAVMEILKERIWAAVGELAESCRKCVPEPRAKDSVDKQRRQNFAILWDVSEDIKFFQSAAREQTDETREEFAKEIKKKLTKELVLDSSPGGTLKPDPKVQRAIENMIDENQHLIGLNEIYDYQIENDLSQSKTSYTVRDRIEQSIIELSKFASQRKVTIDFVVFGGAGSRLPLVEELVSSRIEGAKIIQDKQRTKFRVAEGLARFLNASEMNHDFARSSDYTISEFGFVVAGTREFVPIVPNCVRVDAPDVSHKIANPDTSRSLSLMRICDKNSQLIIYRQDQGGKTTEHGRFDLSVAPHDGGKIGAKGFAQRELKKVHGEIRMCGSEEAMQLVVTDDGNLAGTWHMIPSDPDVSQD